MSYGYFRLDEKSRNFLLKNSSRLVDPLLRGAAWLSLYEELLNGSIPPMDYLQSILPAIEAEKESLNQQHLLSQLHTLYWRFLNQQERQKASRLVEKTLWSKVKNIPSAGARRAYFKAYQAVALNLSEKTKLEDVLFQRNTLIKLSESDQIQLAAELSIKWPSSASSYLENISAKIKNPDNQRRFEFLKPALSEDPVMLDSFFESLKKEENRQIEPWVVEALGYLHHPLRAKQSEKYILPSLELMEEIQATGDIFFPRRWAAATLGGHQSKEAAQIVRDFLKDRPYYPFRLKNKILMSADLLFRASRRPIEG